MTEKRDGVTLNKSFLVIDDSSTMRQLLVMTLTKMGHPVVDVARNGRVGLEKLLANVPDVVLTDLDMPEMNGLEFIKRARAQYADLPIVIVSTPGDEQTRDQALQLGANGYLTKPITGFQLTEVLREIFPE